MINPELHKAMEDTDLRLKLKSSTLPVVSWGNQVCPKMLYYTPFSTGHREIKMEKKKPTLCFRIRKFTRTKMKDGICTSKEKEMKGFTLHFPSAR